MIEIKITATTAEEARKEMLALIGTSITSTLWVHEGDPAETEQQQEEVKQETPVPAEQPRTRTRTRTPAQPAQAAEPEPTPAPQEQTPAATNDPLASTPAPAVTNDPLAATPAPSSNGTDPLAVKPATPAPAAKQDGAITLDILRAKCAPMASINQGAVKALFARYTKADGTPVDSPSDLQEKDYEAVYKAVDFL